MKPILQTEVPMSFSPRLAKIIGLKEAIVLSEINRGILESSSDFKTYSIPATVIFERKFPFIETQDLWNCTIRLEQLGVIKVDPIDPGINITISPNVERIFKNLFMGGGK
jgi:hypothetical protein